MVGFWEGILLTVTFYDDDLSELGQRVFDSVTYERHAEVANALSRAHNEIASGNKGDALRHLLYAQRLAPSASLITLFIGEARLAVGLPEAAEAFDLLARRSGWRGAWYRLAVTHYRNGKSLLAAADLNEVLHRNSPLSDERSLEFLSQVAKSTNNLGWCGVDNSGLLLIGGHASTLRNADLRVELDGTPIRLGTRQTEKQTSLTRIALGLGWEGKRSLTAFAKNTPLIGSPIDLQALTRVEGLVQTTATGINGWCWLPGEPNRAPIVRIRNSSGFLTDVSVSAERVEDTPDNIERLVWPRTFSFLMEDLPSDTIGVAGPHQKSLYGSPLNPLGSVRSGMISTSRISRRFPALGESQVLDADVACEVSVPAAHRGTRVSRTSCVVGRRILVAVPVYSGFTTTMDCLRTVLHYRTSDQDILVISDASPEENLNLSLSELARRNPMTLLLETENRGFPGTANIALRKAAEAGNDVILLNSDTLVTVGWAKKLQQAVYAGNDIGTATPFSNSATILSYPYHDQFNPIRDQDDVNELAAAFVLANGTSIVDLPTGHGFCIYIRHECLVETGLLREDVFAQGYGEENDFCLRARHLGWRHVAAAGMYVGHAEGQSFAAAKTSLMKRNLDILNTLHPGYDKLIAEWQFLDPLANYRRQVDQVRWSKARGTRPARCFVTHDREGGVLRHVEMRAAEAEEQGSFAIICKPGKNQSGAKICILSSPRGDFPNLRFNVSDELGLVRALLKTMDVAHTEIHHIIGHDRSAIDIFTKLGTPYDVHIHDYSWFCPRITLMSHGNRYCGEPDINGCTMCIQDLGSKLDMIIMPRELVAWSSKILLGAQNVNAPSEDTARRFQRHFDIKCTILNWEDEALPLKLKAVRSRKVGEVRRICIAGAVGYEKGYDVILACARYISINNVPLEFRIVGFTRDDRRLFETGRVKITGRYEESEAVTLIREQDADLAFMPALWPETWSYVLSQLWEAGLPVVTFDLGAPSERIRKRGGGLLLPLALTVDRVVQVLLSDF